MVQADTAHESKLADDSSFRDTRDGAAAKLSESVIELRNVITELYDTATARAVIVGQTPRDSIASERFAGEVVHNLGNVAWSQPRFTGAGLNAQAVQRVDCDAQGEEKSA